VENKNGLYKTIFSLVPPNYCPQIRKISRL